MKKDSLWFRLLVLFLVFLKTGALTFGGGYAMIPIIQNEVAGKRKWVTDSEIIDIIAIAESTPGPIAVNTATYVGYKVAGVIGSIVATLGLVIPSFVIIFVISFFYKDFMRIAAIQAMFKGLKVGVIILLFSALIKLSKGVKLNLFTIILFVIGFSIMVLANFLPNNFNYWSLCLILFGALCGIIGVIISKKKGENK